MDIIFFTHPNFLAHQSMPRFAQMLMDGMRERGHTVKRWTPKARAFALPAPNFAKKWLGYIDQYVIFPIEVKLKLKKEHPKTLFVFTDHALGPWVPLVHDLPHIIHCHDFLAQYSAQNLIPENPTSCTGKIYQSYIKKGFQKGKYFLSVSKKTQIDLHHFQTTEPELSEVVYNGLSRTFAPGNKNEVRKILSAQISSKLNQPYILHVGGNAWYKNRKGVVEVYTAWRKKFKHQVPILLIGTKADDALQSLVNDNPFRDDIIFATNLKDELVNMAYIGAKIFIFPSFAEGFGWPIAEAMACGCPVITTNESPMTEVGGEAALYIEKKPCNPDTNWAFEAATILNKVFSLTKYEEDILIEKGIANAKRFNTVKSLDEIEHNYKQVLSLYND